MNLKNRADFSQAQFNLTILGSTGFIGEATLEVAQNNPEIQIYALVGHQNHQKLFQQIEKFQPKVVFMTNQSAYQELKNYPFNHQVIFADSIDEITEDSNSRLVMAAIATSAGLPSILATLKQGKTLLLANKESLVMAGNLMIDEAQKNNALIVPVDSEHNAILQCLPIHYRPLSNSDLSSDFGLDKIILTASGGSLWNKKSNQEVSLSEALSHPNWSMGQKITVDSNTMVNKGLEMIEASYLFNLAAEKIECLIHPQSIVHGLVYFKDKSTLAALAHPDMKVSIAYAMSYAIYIHHSDSFHISNHSNKDKPIYLNRLNNQTNTLDLVNQSLDFYPIDLKKYPCFALAKKCLLAGGNFPLFFNIANEVAVELFLAQKISFPHIEYLITECLAHAESKPISSLAEVYDLDNYVRHLAEQYFQKIQST